MNPLVHRFITVSADLERWLVDGVGISQRKVTRICNGVDPERFRPATSEDDRLGVRRRFPKGTILVGSVLRFNEIKDPMNLVTAFIKAHARARAQRVTLGLAMVGDGPLHRKASAAIAAAELDDMVWLPGARDDVSRIMRALDLFVLGSRREGISNTLLEAMATGLPLIATQTGGNEELMRERNIGALIPVADPDALSDVLLRYALDHQLRARQGESARSLAVRKYSLSTMVEQYQSVYADASSRQRG